MQTIASSASMLQTVTATLATQAKTTFNGLSAKSIIKGAVWGAGAMDLYSVATYYKAGEVASLYLTSGIGDINNSTSEWRIWLAGAMVGGTAVALAQKLKHHYPCLKDHQIFVHIAAGCASPAIIAIANHLLYACRMSENQPWLPFWQMTTNAAMLGALVAPVSIATAAIIDDAATEAALKGNNS